MAVFCTGATVPTPVYRWYKYSANSETITTKTYSAGRSLLSLSAASSSSDVAYGSGQLSVSPVTIASAAQIGAYGNAGESSSATVTVSAGTAWKLTLTGYFMKSDGTTTTAVTDTISGPALDTAVTFTLYTSVYSSYYSSWVTADKAVVVTLDDPITQYSQGDTYYGIVESADEDAYPDGGHQDGYWYVRMGAA